MQQLHDQRNSNFMARWEAQQAEWTRLLRSISSRTQREPEELAMSDHRGGLSCAEEAACTGLQQLLAWMVSSGEVGSNMLAN